MKKPEYTNFNQVFEECKQYCLERLLHLTHSRVEAEELFSEAIARYWVYWQQGKIKHQNNVKAYVLVTAKRLWMEQKRKTNQTYSTEAKQLNQIVDQQIDMADLAAFDYLIQQENEAKAKEQFEQKQAIFQMEFQKLDARSQQLLSMKYALNVPAKELANKFGFKSERVVITTIYRCKQKLLKAIKKHLVVAKK